VLPTFAWLLCEQPTLPGQGAARVAPFTGPGLFEAATGNAPALERLRRPRAAKAACRRAEASPAAGSAIVEPLRCKAEGQSEVTPSSLCRHGRFDASACANRAAAWLVEQAG
jgi:hypothetical protein